mmetsp:Transcript_1731/g.3752  ORF Transcript_1731/g.3752 Transcript_1731/m.3752 type:complete len:184 (+) Transcript_1731:144-695(+)
MVCQKSRDRQQGHQKQRSLPPKKRSIPHGVPLTFGTSTSPKSLFSIPGIETTTISTRQPVQVQAVPSVSSDDRSIGASSTTSSQASFNNSVVMTNNNNYVGSLHTTRGVLPSIATTAPVATVTPKTTAMSFKRCGASGIMPFISNDKKFVASTLRQRESLEVYRAAKAMLFDAYMKAVNAESP